MPSSPLKENLTIFFHECEELLANYNLQDFLRYEVEYKFTRQIGLLQDCKPKIEWILVRNHFEEEVKKLESINHCVYNLTEYFGLIYATEKPGFVINEQFIKNSIDSRKRELVWLFFEYKRMQEEFDLSISDFVTLLIKGVWSESVYFKTTAQLIGFRTNLEKIKIHNFTIRLPTDDELNRIIYDNERRHIFKISNPSDIASVGLSFLQGTQFWVFMETQQIRLENLHIIPSLYQQNELNKDNDISKIIKDFKKLILALRLYNGNYIGIRSIFINKSFVYENNHFEPWREYPFLDSEFGNFRKIRYSYDLVSKEIYSDDVEEINTIFRNLMLYEWNPLEQIDRALEHFFKAFEQNYPVYTFTELIMSLETILHENVKSNSEEKLNLIRKIREADNENIGLSILKEYMDRNSIQKSINMLNQLISPGKRDKRLNKFFLDYKNNGCYKIRNDLLHGNLKLDSAEIRTKIPDLEEYVRLALLRILDLRINNKLNCNEQNYFEKLDEILKI